MRSVLMFLAGIVVGVLAMQPTAAQSDGIVALNHVGIGVSNMGEAMNCNLLPPAVNRD